MTMCIKFHTGYEIAVGIHNEVITAPASIIAGHQEKSELVPRADHVAPTYD